MLNRQSPSGLVYDLSYVYNLLKLTARNVIAAAFDPTSTPARTNGAPAYSAEYLSELKASTPSTRPRLQDDDSVSYDADVSLATDTLAQSSLAPIVDLTGE